jgi:hypothetical protein
MIEVVVAGTVPVVIVSKEPEVVIILPQYNNYQLKSRWW